MERTKNLTGSEKGEDQDERLSLAKRRILNLENYNHNMSNQMISLLNSINDNVLSLTSLITDRSLLGNEEGKDRGKARSKDETTTDITYSCLDQEVHRTQ